MQKGHTTFHQAAQMNTHGMYHPSTTAKKVSSVKKKGTFKGKSNALGHGGRAAQLKAKGVPAGVIGNLARAAQAAPGQKNYHGGKTA